MRTFIALTLPPHILHQIIRTTAGFHSQIKNGVRWTPPENLHLTLRFLGESNPDRLVDLQEKLEQLRKHPAFEITFKRYGVFPAWKSPSTIWLGVEKNSDLENLAKTVETMAREVGFRPEKKPFRPHITIARVKRNPSPFTVQQIKRTFKEQAGKPQILLFQACHVVLFQSILKPQGAQYKALQTLELSR